MRGFSYSVLGGMLVSYIHYMAVGQKLTALPRPDLPQKPCPWLTR